MNTISTKEHYDLLIKEGNDPVFDPPPLREYMDKWDGQPFIDALSLTPSSDVLEIGIGTGRIAKKVLSTGCKHLTGIDISPLTIVQAKSNLSNWSNISLITNDFIDYAFEQKFDVVYCSLTFFHIKDKNAAIDKISNLLKSPGLFVLSISKDNRTIINFGTRFVEIFPDNLDEIQQLFVLHDLEIIKVIHTEFAHIIVGKKI